MPTTPALASAAASFGAGSTDSVTFSTAFDTGRLYAQRPPPPAPPGLLAVGEPGNGHVLVFTSLDQLARHAGECDWLSTTGADLLALLPDGHGLLVDAAGDHPLVLPPAALRRSTVPSPTER